MPTTTISRSPAPLGLGKVGRGVALYSYQEEFLVGQMTLKDCLQEAADIGAVGIELIAETFVPQFPHPPSVWVDEWLSLTDQLNLVPACYTQFLDTLRTRSHVLSIGEAVETMLRDIRLAKLLNIRRIRCLSGTPTDVIEATIPHLEREGVWMGIELHAPVSLTGRLVERMLRIAEKTDVFGFVPDMGIFQHRANPFMRERAIRDGRVTRELATQIEAGWESGLQLEQLTAELSRQGVPESALGHARQVFRASPQDPKHLIPLLPWCKHIHGKTWGLTEECVDPAIDLSSVVPVLVEHGFEGYIATEYEGQRLVQDVYPFSEVEMVRRYHVMLRRLLGE